MQERFAPEAHPPSRLRRDKRRRTGRTPHAHSVLIVGEILCSLQERICDFASGEVQERLNWPPWKGGIPATVSWVRIPPSPQNSLRPSLRQFVGECDRLSCSALSSHEKLRGDSDKCLGSKAAPPSIRSDQRGLFQRTCTSRYLFQPSVSRESPV